MMFLKNQESSLWFYLRVQLTYLALRSALSCGMPTCKIKGGDQVSCHLGGKHELEGHRSRQTLKMDTGFGNMEYYLFGGEGVC